MRSDGDAVVVEHLTKTYRAGVGRARVREMMPPPLDGMVARAFPRWWAKHTFDALHDISFSVPKGGSLALVGHNGAGKTTMLKVLAGITQPTSGTFGAEGRVAALIDILVGFHPDLTGAENVYLLGAVYGLGRRAMRERVERILDFAEIDQLAKTPVKRYSTGMVARLGFATIAALDADVLLVDEVLAVGDARFQRKCVEWLDDYRGSGGTLLFVSHNLALVRSMTERAVWLDHGQIMAEGPTPDVLTEYGRAMEYRPTTGAVLRKGKANKAIAARGLHRWGAGGARLNHVRIDHGSTGTSGCYVKVDYTNAGIDEAIFCVGFLDESERQIGGAASQPMKLVAGEGDVECRMPRLPLHPGIYFPVVSIVSTDGVIRDTWRMDQAVVVEQDGLPAFASDLGPLAIDADWSEGRMSR